MQRPRGRARPTIFQEVKKIEAKYLGEIWTRSCEAVKWEGGVWEGQWGVVARFEILEGGMWQVLQVRSSCCNVKALLEGLE